MALRRIGARRWEAFLVFVVAVSLVVLVKLIVPVGRSRLASVQQVREQLEAIAEAESFPVRIRSAETQLATLDSTLGALAARDAFDEARVVEEVYRLAERAQCSAAKVQILEPIVTESGIELPIAFEGQGTYAAIGEFIDGIENMPCATRIRHLTIKKEEKATGTISADFVVIDIDELPAANSVQGAEL